jgi:glycosyltransferase involved in cell wall biosynthesis
MHDAPSLSVLIPAYRASAFIKETLDSIQAQTFQNFRAYVSVDVSDDDTFAICQTYLKNDPRFVVIEQHEHLGWVKNSNFLLDQVTTPYAVFAFHDDTLHPDYFEKLIQALKINPQAIVAFSDTLLTTRNQETQHWTYTELEGVVNLEQRAITILQRKGHWWVPNRGVFRSSLAKKIGGLKLHASGEFSADLAWLLHMSFYGEFVRVPETLCFKYYKSDSLSRSWKFDQQSKIDALASCMRELWTADIPTNSKVRVAIPLMKTMMHQGIQR